jgi:REP element-mobilizing transposase RayT
MTRPLRLEFPGALYHVTSRGDRQEAIFADDVDRMEWLCVLALICTRYNFIVYGFCQMANHYHLIIETAEGNLGQGMRQLNGLYSQYFNRRHKVVGHLFQGRYKAIVVQRESYLLELARYVVLNPLRAGMVESLDEWPWSSYACTMGQAPCPSWLNTTSILRHFGAEPHAAIEAYHHFVIAGIGRDNPLKKTQHQLLLGDEKFLAKARELAPSNEFLAVAKTYRRAVSLPLEQYRTTYPQRDEAVARAYHSTAYTMAQIANHFGISAKTVGRAIKRFEQTSSCPNVGTDPGVG